MDTKKKKKKKKIKFAEFRKQASRSLVLGIHALEFWDHVLHDGEGNGTPLQYSCPEKSHGWRSLVGCSPWGR